MKNRVTAKPANARAWHAMTADEALRAVTSSPQGLFSSGEARQRLRQHGPLARQEGWPARTHLGHKR